jgi:hypothetical protein
MRELLVPYLRPPAGIAQVAQIEVLHPRSGDVFGSDPAFLCDATAPMGLLCDHKTNGLARASAAMCGAASSVGPWQNSRQIIIIRCTAGRD